MRSIKRIVLAGLLFIPAMSPGLAHLDHATCAILPGIGGERATQNLPPGEKALKSFVLHVKR